LKIERALDRYARGGISFGAAAHLAGVSQSDLARHAYTHGMEPPFSAEAVAEELS
jgi:predicted HTH domain antitoxin